MRPRAQDLSMETLAIGEVRALDAQQILERTSDVVAFDPRGDRQATKPGGARPMASDSPLSC